MTRWALVLAAAGAEAACTPKQPVAEREPSRSVEVEVINDLEPQGQCGITIVNQALYPGSGYDPNRPGTGLGIANPGERTRFVYSPASASSACYMSASCQDSRPRGVSSRQFALQNATGVVWYLRANDLAAHEH